MIADELDERRCVRLPILRKAFQIFENGAGAGCSKNYDGVFSVLVKIGVEDAHVLKVGFAIDLEEIPSQIV
jgi:hypothetical protein